MCSTTTEREEDSMGYTHYWRRRQEIPAEVFQNIKDDFTATLPYLREAGVRLAGPLGGGEPRIDSESVGFNGVRDCGHPSVDLGITWPADNARGVVMPRSAEDAPVSGSWFAGAKLGARTCGGDCSHESFNFPRVLRPRLPQGKPEDGFWFDCCKTAYKPYDLAVTVFLVIAKHHLGRDLRVSSDGGAVHWREAVDLCRNVLGYGRVPLSK
jgi:hypothetical protein